jgi:predicted transcriptional regulator
MSDLSPNLPENPAPTAPDSLPKLDPVDVLFALGSSVRWPIVKLLAEGRALTITEAAAVAGCTRENMGKQMLVLLNAGVVECRAGEDRRHSVYSIPATRRPASGVIDYGFCKIDLRQA